MFISEVVHLFYFFQDGSTALHWAAKCSVKDSLEFLIEKGANVNIQDDVSTNISNIPNESCQQQIENKKVLL